MTIRNRVVIQLISLQNQWERNVSLDVYAVNEDFKPVLRWIRWSRDRDHQDENTIAINSRNN